MKTSDYLKLFIIILLFFVSVKISNSQTGFLMGRQFGSAKDEYALNHVVDNNGNIFIAGKTNGIMEERNYGKNDGFLTKIDSLGNTLWTKQFGSDGDEDILWSAIDNSGSVYITGSTTGTMGDRKFGKEDILLIKFSSEGRTEWVKQFGTDSTDIARGIYADNKGYVYITGMTGGKLGKSTSGKTDCFLMKLDNMGKTVSVMQFGTPGDDCGYSVTGGPGSDIFICGTTWGDLSGRNKGFIDGFTGSFTNMLELKAYNQFGTDGFDIAMILSVDGEGNLYVGGSTSGNFGGNQKGEGDAYILKMNPQGEILWNKQFGTEKHDGVRGIAASSDKILISGLLHLPPAEAFIRMYRKDGEFVWERKFIAQGKNGDTSGKDVNIDKRGIIYHMGLTGANLFSPNNGEHDFYIVKLLSD